jgi:hypothetical protein
VRAPFFKCVLLITLLVPGKHTPTYPASSAPDTHHALPRILALKIALKNLFVQQSADRIFRICLVFFWTRYDCFDLSLLIGLTD